MLHNRDLLMFGNDWNRFPSPLQHIAMTLAESNRILWVGSVSLRKPRFQMYDFGRIAERLSRILFASRSQTGHISVVQMNPFILPYYDSPLIRRVNDRMLRFVLSKRLRDLSFSDFIVFSFTPLIVDIIGTLGESSSHYFCVDDYSQFDHAYESVPKLERLMLKKVDSCFAVSEPLMNTRITKNGENHFLSQGVDTNHFRPMDESPPPVLASIKKPIVGFFGQLASYVDIELIVRSAKAYPDVSFVIIGRPMVDISAFSQSSNITFLGEVPYEQLPSYARVFDVGLNPRVVSELTRAMSPMKVPEYLSLGMPVVSTDFPEIRKFKDVVHIARSREHFIELIGVALRETHPGDKEARRRVAEGLSWKSVASHVSNIVHRIDRTKRAGQGHGNK